MTKVLRFTALTFALVAACAQAEGEEATPRNQPDAGISLYTPEQHDLYDGHFVLSAARIYQVGRLDDPAGWDHMGNDASNVHPVQGTVEVDVDEIKNTGRFVARLKVPEGDLVLAFDRFHEFNPCQDGGVATYIYEHGDSGCGDANWPKTFIYLAAGDMDMRCSMGNLCTTTTKCTSWSPRASATARHCGSITRC